MFPDAASDRAWLEQGGHCPDAHQGEDHGHPPRAPWRQGIQEQQRQRQQRRGDERREGGREAVGEQGHGEDEGSGGVEDVPSVSCEPAPPVGFRKGARQLEQRRGRERREDAEHKANCRLDGAVEAAERIHRMAK